MKYVYILQSLSHQGSFYVGCTHNLKRRLKEHNQGLSVYTNQLKPWHLETYIAFSDPLKANRFEAYLKSGSGRTFAKKHL